MVKFWNSCISEWEGRLTLHKGGSSRSFMTMTIWWPRSDRGDFSCRRAVDSSSFVVKFCEFLVSKELRLNEWHCGSEITLVHVMAQYLLAFTHWGWDKMVTNFLTTFSNAFSWIKICKLQLKFHWSLFPVVQLTIFQHWFRKWLGNGQVTCHYLNGQAIIWTNNV